MKIHRDIIQGTDEWLAVRRAKATASNFDRIITPSKLELAKGHDTFLNELIAECYVTEQAPQYDSFWTKRGKELEPTARLRYQAMTGAHVDEIGFITHDNGILGCSPDGLVKGADGEYTKGLEIKCGAPFTHVGWIRAGVLPQEHLLQVHGSMVVTGLRAWDFFAFFPGMKPLYIPVTWNETTDKIQAALLKFCDIYREEFERTKPLLQTNQLED